MPIHPALRRPAYVVNGTLHAFPGILRAKVTGGLTYPVGDTEGCAWEGGYYGENRQHDPPAPWPNRWQKWDPGRLNQFADSIRDPILVLNIEHYGDHETGRLIDIIEAIRARRSGLAIGVWSIVPASAFWIVQEYAQYIDYKAGRPHMDRPATWWEHPTVGPARVKAFRRWQRANDLAARKLVPHVDFLCPSCYPVIEPAESEMWTAAREPELVIDECRRVAPGLPVLASVYPYISDLRKVASPGLMRVLTNACRAADGTMVWGDQNTPLPVLAAAIAQAETRQD